MTVLGTALKRNSLENPSVPISAVGLAEWMTGYDSSAGVPVTEQRVLGLPAYYRALAVTSGTLAAMPIKVYKNGTRERVRQRTVLDSPNPRQTPVEYWMTTYANAIGWGSAFSRKLRDGADVVRQVWPIHPARVRVEEVDPTDADPAGKLFHVRDAQGRERTYTSRDIFHLPYMSPDGITGVRPMQVFRQSLGIAIAADDTSARFYKNGTLASGILTTDADLQETTADRLKKRWQEKVAGQANAGQVAIMDNGVKFQQISIPPADAQLLQSRQWNVAEIARMVGTPPHLIGEASVSTWGTGIEQIVLGWVKFTLQGWISSSEQRITRELLPGGWDSGSWFAELELANLLRGDAASRAAFYHSGITDGWMNRAEARGYETLAPADAELDEFIVPSNMTIISVDGSIIPAKTPDAAAPEA